MVDATSQVVVVVAVVGVAAIAAATIVTALGWWLPVGLILLVMAGRARS